MATWSDRGAELWDFWGYAGNTCSSSEDDSSPYPSSNASPRYGSENGDWKWDYHYRFRYGMSDLGEPPVSAGFSEEVALSRRV